MLQYILLIKEQNFIMSVEMVRADRLFLKKKIDTNFHIELARLSIVMEFIALPRLSNFGDMMQTMNEIVC